MDLLRIPLKKINILNNRSKYESRLHVIVLELIFVFAEITKKVRNFFRSKLSKEQQHLMKLASKSAITQDSNDYSTNRVAN